MRRAIDLSQSFTELLQKEQHEALAELALTAGAVAKRMEGVRKSHEAMANAINDATAAAIETIEGNRAILLASLRDHSEMALTDLGALRDRILALSAKLQDGDDDMAKAFAGLRTAQAVMPAASPLVVGSGSVLAGTGTLEPVRTIDATSTVQAA